MGKSTRQIIPEYGTVRICGQGHWQTIRFLRVQWCLCYTEKMTKVEIARAVSEKTNITQLEAKRIVQNVLDVIVETLVEEGRLELRNFGVLEVRERAARKARNPRTGEAVQVKKKRVVVFKAGKALEDAVQGKAKQKKK